MKVAEGVKVGMGLLNTQAPAYRIPGQEGPSTQRQVGHELDSQACAAVPSHDLGVAVGSGHVQDQVGPKTQSISGAGGCRTRGRGALRASPQGLQKLLLGSQCPH